MRVLSADQPHPQLMVTRQPCDCHPGEGHEINCPHTPARGRAMVKRIHTATYPFPYLGQRVAIYATAGVMPCRHCLRPIRRHGGRTGDSWNHLVNGSLLHRCQGNVPRYGYDAAPFTGEPCNCYACDSWGRRPWDGLGPLPLGAIVGSCQVTANLPIVERNDMRHNEPPFITINTPTGALSLWHAEDHPTPWERIDDQLPFGDFTPGMHAWILEEAQPLAEPIPWTHHGGRLPEWTAT